jgi:large subunit ribosomal protein L15
MTTRKDKKVKRFRGSKTHGYGSMKKNRGAGNRGGRGLAGSGKRAGHKIHAIIKKYGTNYLGKYGFASGEKKVIKGINLKDIEIKLNSIMDKGFAKKEGDKISVDLTKLGYDKLLGSGNVTTKFKVIVRSFSKKAKEKIEKIGGEIVSS